MLPLILISQQSRSGGSLFAQLLDAHPQLLVHPHEMNIGWPTKIRWPEVDTDIQSDLLFDQICKNNLQKRAKGGYSKGGKSFEKRKYLDFSYDRDAHKQLFSKLMPPAPRSRRQVISTYMASLFEVWDGVHQPSIAEYYSGFVPELGSRAASVDAFFSDYPDGRLVSIIREPADWLVSRRAHTKGGVVRHHDLEREISLWRKMVRAAHKYREEYRANFFLVRFEALIDEREHVMRRFSEWIGVDWNSTLLDPTFNGQAIDPNSNFSSIEGVTSRRLALSRAELELIRDLTESDQDSLRSIYSI